MSFSFQNSYSPTASVWVLIVYQDNSCSYPWRKEGWWEIAPGQTVTVYGGDLQSSSLSVNWYYYAQASDGAVWTSAGPSVEVNSSSAFNQCTSDNSGCDETVNLRDVNINGYDNYTLQLVPASGVPWDNFSNFSNFQNWSNFGNFDNSDDDDDDDDDDGW
jgi:uncharacterized membrane protein